METDFVSKGRITIRTCRMGELSDRKAHHVEIWIGGWCFTTKVNSREQAIELVRTTAIDLGILP